jgi:ATP-binding cassette, subfamily B, bacterial
MAMLSKAWIDLGAWKAVWPWLRPMRAPLAVVLFWSLAATLAGLAQPLLSQWLIDEALLGRNVRALWWSAGGLIVLSLLGFVLNTAASYQYTRLSASVLFAMRLSLFQHLQTLSPRFHQQTRPGDIAARLNGDLGEVQRISADALLGIFSSFCFLVGALFLMARLNPWLFLMGLLTLPLSMLMTRLMEQRITQGVQAVRERSAGMGSFLIDSLLGMRMVVLSGAEAREADRFRLLNADFVSALLRLQRSTYLASALPTAFSTLSTAIVFLYGGWQVMEGRFTLGGLAAFLALYARLTSPLQQLAGIYNQLVTGKVALQRVMQIFEQQALVKESTHPQLPVAHQGELQLKDVSYAHPGREASLQNVSLHVLPGEFCVITGASGAGKSTLLDLLLRLYDPDAGSLQLDGVDLKAWPLQALRHSIAIADQTPIFFATSIADNLRFAAPQASVEELRAACHLACIDEWVEALPTGYETIMAERGQNLSAGERQRLAIAAALLRKSTLIVLDEPTAALDEVTEALLVQRLKEATQGRTVLATSHRPALLRVADRVFHLDQGVLQEQPAVVRH